MLIPININLHWSLCVVITPSTTDHPTNTQSLRPQIMVLDSADIHDKIIIAQHIRTWLEHEWITRNAPTPLPKAYQSNEFPTTTPITPKQTNGYDCGVYILQFAQEILEHYYNTQEPHPQHPNLHITFKADVIPNLRIEIRNELEAVNLQQTYPNLPINRSKSSPSQTNTTQTKRNTWLPRDIIPICDKSKLGLKQIGNKIVKNTQIGDKKKPQFADENPNLFS